jgi:dethiobiotin synthetase
MPHAIFVTGTDTGVGKTITTAALATALRRRGYSVGVMKPVETGVAKGRPSDAGRLRQAARVTEALHLVRPYAFRLPLAPLDAANAEQRRIRFSTIMQAYRTLHSQHDLLLVEGAGGVHVPITPAADVLDLIVRMKIPAVVVGRSGLGGVNHAVLTLNALRQRTIPVLALVLNRTVAAKTAVAQRQERSTVKLLRQRAGVPVIGPLPYVSDARTRFEEALLTLATNAEMKQLTKLALAFARGGR